MGKVLGICVIIMVLLVIIAVLLVIIAVLLVKNTNNGTNGGQKMM